MKIIIPGGSGQIGTILARAFQRDGHEVVVVSRRSSDSSPWRVIVWDGHTLGEWTKELEGADVVINLAGRSVTAATAPGIAAPLCRLASTPPMRLAPPSSKPPARRVSGCKLRRRRFTHIALTCLTMKQPACSAGREENAPSTWRFSIDVAKAWERAAQESSPLPNTRVVLMRSAITLSPDSGGAFDLLLKLVRHGLGGRAGDGRQYVSWIHEADFVRAVYWLIEHEDLSGPMNLAAPNPLPNAEFMRILREASGIRFGLPASRLVLKLGALLIRTETELILKSRRVVPGRLLQDGFVFNFPNWQAAAIDLCSRWRARPG